VSNLRVLSVDAVSVTLAWTADVTATRFRIAYTDGTTNEFDEPIFLTVSPPHGYGMVALSPWTYIRTSA